MELRKGITTWKDRGVDGKIVNFKAEITELEDGRATCAVFMNDQLIKIGGQSKDLLKMFPNFDTAVNYIKDVKAKIEENADPNTTTLRTKKYEWTDFNRYDKRIKCVANVQEFKDKTLITIQFSDDERPEIIESPNWAEALIAMDYLLRQVNSKNIQRN
jgi:hypothetical protein